MRSDDLDALVRQAKRAAPPEPDWDRVERDLEGRLDDAEALDATAGRGVHATRSRAAARAWAAAAVVVSLAAGAVLLVGHGRVSGDRPEEPAASAKDAVSAAFLGTVGRDGASPVAGAVVTVGGHPIEVGKEIARGDVIEVKGASAVFERAHKVVFGVEDDGRIAVEGASAEGPLVVSLESGAIEADVVPVKNGESFAIDIPVRVASGATHRVRVAVHGTHLRVMRDGTMVSVDVMDGVVSIGNPPRAGATYGTLVVAPAHVELDAMRLDSIRISHEATDVKQAASLKVASSVEPRAGALAWKADPEPTEPPPPSDTKIRPGRGEGPAATQKEAKQAAHGPTVDPKLAIVQAVKTCVTSRMQPGAVRVTVSTALSLVVGGDGRVRTATFSPPLDPEVQACSAAAIYATDFGPDTADSRAISLAIEAAR